MTEEPKDIKIIFSEVLAIEDPKERKLYLDKAGEGNQNLRAEIEKLLDAHVEAGDFLESPAVEVNVTLDTSPSIEGPGTKIGHYELLELIGEGGMGLVYLAEQKEPVRRKVVLKIVKPGMDSKQVIARFEAERQALAVLDHPNIAHVFDAGATAAGRPYFVMEYVKGMSITRYCDEKKLNIEQRLRLFEQVCEGVYHAHQKGIIHRDLKPSNILVSVHGDRAVPKIIDFGIAKAITQPLTDKTFVTFQGQLLGTPEYMSPEQVDLATQDIDTRSDIYSLGVVLYELLAGVLPFEEESFARAGFAEIQRTIREAEPASPSIRLTSLGEKAKTIAASRGTQVVPLVRRLHRELEWIPLKAMRKDRCRRYRSASEMADDIRNYLTGLPLIAGPETSIYRVQKFVRKHAGSVVTVALIAIAIVLGLVVSTVMYFRAESMRVQAEDAHAKEALARNRAEEAEKKAEEKAESYRRLSYSHGIALADAKYREANMSRLRKLLNECPEDLRGWEWHRLDHVVDQATMTIRGHSDCVYSTAFSPDAKWIVSGSWDTTVRIWDPVTGAEVKVLRGHTGYVNSVTFSPDGKRIASGSADKTVRVWDLANIEEPMVFRGHRGKIYSVAFSPDGSRIVSGSADKTARIYDATTGKELQVFHAHNHEICSVAFSPDGRRIAAAVWGGPSVVWDAATGEVLTTLHGQKYSELVAFSPDGQYIISGGRAGVIRVRDSATGNTLTALRGHEGWTNHVAFSPDGKRIISCGYDGTIRIWDAATGIEQRVLRGHQGAVFCVSFSPDGTRIVSGGDVTIKLWDAYVDQVQLLLRGHETVVTGLAFGPHNKQLVSGSWDGTVKIWDIASGVEKLTLHGIKGQVESVAFNPDGKLIASAGSDKTIRFWDAGTGEQLNILRGHEAGVLSVAFSPDGRRIISGSIDRTARVWDVATGDQVMTLRGHSGQVRCVNVSPDNKQIVSGDSKSEIKIWDAVTGDELRTLHARAGYVMHVAYSVDGKCIVSSDGRMIRVWDAATGDELTTVEGHNGAVWSAVFSRDGKRIISSSDDGTARVWDSENGQELMVMPGNPGLRSGALSMDGGTFAAGGVDGSIVLWECSAPPEWCNLRQMRGRALAIVKNLYTEQGLYHAVTEKLNREVALAGPVLQLALQIANSRKWEDANNLKNEAWETVGSVGRDIVAYQTALTKAEKANSWEPNNPAILTILGAAQYRLAFYEDALKTLTKSERILSDAGEEFDPVNTAFRAMTLFKIGWIEEANTALEQLRELCKDEQFAEDMEVQTLLAEAEKLITGEKQ